MVTYIIIMSDNHFTILGHQKATLRLEHTQVMKK